MYEFGMGLIYFFIHTNVMEDVTMKTKILVCLMLASLLAVWGCSNDPKLNSPNLEPESKGETSLQKTGCDSCKIDDFKPLLENIAKYIAKNHVEIVEGVRDVLLEKTKVLEDIFPQSPFETSVIGVDGTPYEIGIEFSRRSTLNDEPLRIAIDPDRFYPNESKYPAFRFDRYEDKINIEEIDKRKDTRLSFPLAFVTLEDRSEISWDEMKAKSKIFNEYGLTGNITDVLNKTGKGEDSNTLNSSYPSYLNIQKIRLNIELDGATNEEFEIYIREGSGFGDPVFKNTTHKFDGHSREDARGHLVYYPDVNNKNTDYYCNVSLWPLSGVTPISLAMIEDDCSGGKYAKGIENSGEVTITYHQEYRHSTGTIVTNVDRKHESYPGCFLDPDDIYKSGMFSEFTKDNAPRSLTQFSLDDLSIKLIRVDDVSPSPSVLDAPVISGSFSNGHPKISWSAVTHADGYKVFRAVGSSTGSYTQIATTGSTNYVDTELDQYDHGTKTYVYYKVKAYNSSGDSGYSNIIQFTVNEFLY